MKNLFVRCMESTGLNVQGEIPAGYYSHWTFTRDTANYRISAAWFTHKLQKFVRELRMDPQECVYVLTIFEGANEEVVFSARVAARGGLRQEHLCELLSSSFEISS
jgi:hypothetical protein